jgi:hypothetical protein
LPVSLARKELIEGRADEWQTDFLICELTSIDIVMKSNRLLELEIYVFSPAECMAYFFCRNSAFPHYFLEFSVGR